MMKMKKTNILKALLGLFALTLIFCMNTKKTLANEEDEIKTGFKVIYEKNYVEPGSIDSKEYSYYANEAIKSYWLSFSSDFLYESLTEQEKKCWSYFEDSLVSIIEGTDDVSSVEYSEPIVIVSSASQDEEEKKVYDFLLKFKLNHPQFYFLSNVMSISMSKIGDETGIYPSLNIYSDFVKGNDRKNATQKFKSQIDNWLEEINGQKTLHEDIEQRAVKTLCDNTSYEFGTFDQSAYSLVCEGKTVCAGYSATLNMLLNASGIECITVTSSNHAWNIANIHDVWYCVDATNVDYSKANGIYRSQFYNKSNNTFRGYGNSWEPSLLWNNIPDTKYDFCCKQWNVLDSQYIKKDSLTYFILNNNKNIDGNKVMAVNVPNEKVNSIPDELEYDSEKYIVINSSAEEIIEGWKYDGTGYKYQNADGTYPKSSWKMIDGKWYYFDASGYRITGWIKLGTTWYYMDSNGIMQANKWINGTYYVKSNGAMAVSEWVDNGKYYVDANGNYVPGKTQVKEGWKQDGTGYWYQNADGTYPKNSWKKIGGNWYYFNASGYRTTGWQKVGSIWYYMDSNGVMQANKWISGTYYVKSNGAMAVSEWVDNNRYYVDANGRWVKGATH